jgi:hypothetical protein
MDLASLKATVRSLRFPDSNAAGRVSEHQIRSLREYVAQCIGGRRPAPGPTYLSGPTLE